jgi:hypothetical protein
VGLDSDLRRLFNLPAVNHEWRKKNPKSQAPNPRQIATTQSLKIAGARLSETFGILDIRICLELGVWDLEFPIEASASIGSSGFRDLDVTAEGE